jgi:hypothetical protein
MRGILTTLILAHLIADYPLQTAWMVEAKKTPRGLLIHVAIHIATTALFVLPLEPGAWPYVLLLGAFHYAIDSYKNYISRSHPTWMAGPYLTDQLLHHITILFVAALLMRAFPQTPLALFQPWMIYVIAYLLATYIWFISERVMFARDTGYQVVVQAEKWSRIVARGLLLTLFLWLLGLPPWAQNLSAAGGLSILPYTTGIYLRRTLLTDFAVAAAAALIVWAVV